MDDQFLEVSYPYRMFDYFYGTGILMSCTFGMYKTCNSAGWEDQGKLAKRRAADDDEFSGIGCFRIVFTDYR